jgi:hypothetical protein
MRDDLGDNLCKFGMAGGSDSHNTDSPYRQHDFYRGHAAADRTPQIRVSGRDFGGIDVRLVNRGGLWYLL